MNHYRYFVFILLLISPALYAAEYNASVQWHRKVTLGTAVSGVVKDIPVAEGQRVAKDTLLLSLDLSAYQAEVTSAKASLDAAQDASTEADLEMQRAEDYFDQDLSSRLELEVVRIAKVKALAELKQAQAVLKQAEYQLRYAQILAPFDGWVLQRRAEVGQVVVADNSAPQLLDFAAADHMRAVTGVSLGNARSIKIGQAVTVLYGNVKLSGKVFSVGMESAGKSGYPLQVVFETKGRRIPINAGVKLVIP